MQKTLSAMLEQIKSGSLEIMGINIEESDVEVKRVEKSGFAASTIQVGQGDDAYHVSLVLDMNDTPELLSKGWLVTLQEEYKPSERT